MYCCCNLLAKNGMWAQKVAYLDKFNDLAMKYEI